MKGTLSEALVRWKLHQRRQKNLEVDANGIDQTTLEEFSDALETLKNKKDSMQKWCRRTQC